jgi:hypothetical protein
LDLVPYESSCVTEYSHNNPSLTSYYGSLSDGNAIYILLCNVLSKKGNRPDITLLYSVSFLISSLSQLGIQPQVIFVGQGQCMQYVNAMQSERKLTPRTSTSHSSSEDIKVRDIHTMVKL